MSITFNEETKMAEIFQKKGKEKLNTDHQNLNQMNLLKKEMSGIDRAINDLSLGPKK